MVMQEQPEGVEQGIRPDIQVEPVDEITQEQQSIDAELDNIEPPSPEYVPREQFDQLLRKLDQQGRHISGLESRIDRSANEIREENQRRAAQQEIALRKQTQEELLESFDDPTIQEKMRAYFSLDNQKAEADLQVRLQQSQAELEPQNPQGSSQDQWNQIFQAVQDFGVDPADKRVNYAALVDQSMTDEERRRAFFQSLRTITTAEAKQAPQQTQQRQAQTPPVAAAPASSTGFRNADEVRDAYVSDKISKDTYIDQWLNSANL